MVLAAAVLLASATCGDDPATVTLCNEVSQDCPSGQTCDLGCYGGQGLFACRDTSSSPTPLGQACDPSGTSCVAGSTCFSPDSNTQPTCAKFCDTDADCPTGKCTDEDAIVSCGLAASQDFPFRVCL